MGIDLHLHTRELARAARVHEGVLSCVALAHLDVTVARGATRRVPGHGIF